MNAHDRGNLQFLLTADPDILRDWYSKTTADDHTYAAEIMALYKEELALKDKFYVVESINLNGLTQDAEAYLKKFRLK